MNQSFKVEYWSNNRPRVQLVCFDPLLSFVFLYLVLFFLAVLWLNPNEKNRWTPCSDDMRIAIHHITSLSIALATSIKIQHSPNTDDTYGKNDRGHNHREHGENKFWKSVSSSMVYLFKCKKTIVSLFSRKKKTLF